MTDLSVGSMDSDRTEFDTLYDTVVSSTESISTKRVAKTIDNPVKRSQPVPDVIVDDSRDDLLTPFSKATMKDRYLSPGESYQDRFANSVRYYANDQAHAQRMYDYISKLWCMPATPILSNGGTNKGNLISCFVNGVQDSLKGIVDIWNENIWMAAKGGGIGTYWGNIRGIGEKAGLNGKTSGAFSFVKVMDSLTACISQGANRRGAAAVYIDISHPEIDTFLDMRREAGGDPERKALNLHHGVCVPDAFMHAVINDQMWDLISPKDGSVTETVRAQDLAAKLVTTRLETGEPYILFVDAINKAMPLHQKKSGLKVTTSNLCSEIVLPTGIDHHGVDRTAICALFQPNAEKWDEWKDNPQFFLDIGYFMDNVLQDFIDNGGEEFAKARYSAQRERSIGVGMMGWHSFLQARNIPLEGVVAKVWNKKIFVHLRTEMDRVSKQIAEERGACLDAAEHGIMERFSCKIAIAPTASVSIICGGTSAGVDAIPANIFTQKTLDGSFEVKNPYLEKILIERGQNTKEIWNSILKNNGSVAHLDFLSDHEKDVYKTSFEIDQRFIIELAADRTPYICQSQSLNIAMLPDCHKRDLWKTHEMAWKLGVKSMYYLRSISIQRTDNTDGTVRVDAADNYKVKNYDECLSCQ